MFSSQTLSEPLLLLGGGLLLLSSFAVILFFIALPYIERKVPILRALRLSSYLRRIPVIGPYYRQAQMARGKIDRTRKQADRAGQEKTRFKKAWDQTVDGDGNTDGRTGNGAPPDDTYAATMTSSGMMKTAVSSSHLPNQSVTTPAEYTPPIGRIPVPPEFAVNLEKASKEKETTVLGRRITRYQVDALIAEGRISSIYQTHDMKMNRLMALKVMYIPDYLDETGTEQVLDQIRALAAVDHPNLVHIYDYGEAQGQLFIVTEFVNGMPIDQHIKHMIEQGQKVNTWHISLTMAYVTSAIADAHHVGIAHGLWKPGHILLETSPGAFSDLPFHVELADAGLGIMYQSVHDMPAEMWPYLSPEQCRGEDASMAGDIYSMGALLYHLAVGKQPFSPQSIEEAIKLHTETEPPLPTAVSPTLPLAIENIILKAMAKEPSERYESAKAMATALWETSQQMTRSAAGSEQFDIGDHILHIDIIGEPRRTIVLDRPTMFTGSSPENEIVLPGVKVARQHVRLEREPDHWVAYHLDPTRSTYLQGTRLLADLPEIWETGQVLLVGPYMLTWEEVTEIRDTPLFAAGQLDSHLVGIVVQPAAGEVSPGKFIDFQINIINQAAHVDHFEVELEGLPLDWVQISNNNLSLLPGDQGQVLLNITPPMDSNIAPDDYPFTVRVVPHSYPKHMATAEVTLIILPYVHVSTDLTPERVRNEGVYQLALHNAGNALADCTLEMLEETNKLLFEYETTPFSLPPGEKMVMKVEAKAWKRPLISQTHHYPFNAQLDVAQMEEPIIHPAQVDVSSRIPLWLVPILGLLLMILCFGLMLAGSTFAQRWMDDRDRAAERANAEPTPDVRVPETGSESSGGSDNTSSIRNDLPTSCSNIKQANSQAEDGEYELYIGQNETMPVTIYCHNMAVSPTTYLTLPANNADQNFSSIVYSGDTVRTDFSKVRIDLATLTIDRTDYTFATSSTEIVGERKIRDYGTAIGCDRDGANNSTAFANIDLHGTSFALSESVQFVVQGNDATGSGPISNDRKTTDLSVTGNCGWVWTMEDIQLLYSPEEE